MPQAMLWFVPALFMLVRPISVCIGLFRSHSTIPQRGLISWFGIRGIGSIYYLMYAVNHGLPRPLADERVAITLVVVATSIVIHGISVTPLMVLYARRQRPRG
jgi:NhaP-type Na+/H+ or K+/H+ antiporter